MQDLSSPPSPGPHPASPSLVALACGILVIAGATVLHDGPPFASWIASGGCALVLLGLLVWRARERSRHGMGGRRAGYGIAALLALVAAPALLPVAAFHLGYLVFLGAVFVVLGVRSQQRVTWVSGAAVAVIGLVVESRAGFALDVSAETVVFVEVLLAIAVAAAAVAPLLRARPPGPGRLAAVVAAANEEGPRT